MSDKDKLVDEAIKILLLVLLVILLFAFADFLTIVSDILGIFTEGT